MTRSLPSPHAVLGLAFDGGAWPASAAGAGVMAAADMPALGPLGLLRAVETALGLGAPDAKHSERVGSWRRKLAAAGPGRFWEKSLAIDPLATAEATLAWRDELVAAGWDAAADASAPRLADLAAAERAAPALQPGEADRLVAAAAALARGEGRPPFARLRLADPRASLPPGLARLVDALAARGVAIEEIGAATIATGTGDLAQLQSALRGDEPAPRFAGDGSLALLSAGSEMAAASALADWLAAGGAGEGSVVLVVDRASPALDAAFARRHLPAPCVAARSPQRGALQLLPLVFAAAWKPFDAVRMLDLLQARPSPIPRELRSRLARALVDAPGRDGPGWLEARDKGLEELEARLAEEEKQDPRRDARRRMERHRARVAAFLDAGLADPVEGIAAERVREACTLLAAWAAGLGEDPLHRALAGACAALAEDVRLDGRAQLPRIELERMIRLVLGEGIEDPGATGEAAPWAVLRDPAALWEQADVVVWWGLAAPPLPRRPPWSEAERAELGARGCAPERHGAAIAQAARGWARPVALARRKLLLVHAPPPGDVEARRHPLLDEVDALLEAGKAPAACMPVAEELLGDAQARLLGTRLPRAELARAALPAPRATWTIPRGRVAARATESASSLELLLGCPFAWAARHSGKLSPGRRAEIPDSARLVGLLAHRLAQEIFVPGAPPEPAAARAAALARLPGLMAEMAAPILAPGAAAEREAMERALPEAMQELASLVARHGLRVTGAEVTRDAQDMPARGQRFTGALDLLLERADGRSVVIDLKWSRSDRRRRAEVEEGRALQLAAYARLVGAGEDAGYFMLAQRRIHAPPGALFGGGGERVPSLAATWAQASASAERRMAGLDGGRLHATGVAAEWKDGKPPRDVPDPDAVEMRLEPPCHFCAFGRICGKEALR